MMPSTIKSFLIALGAIVYLNLYGQTEALEVRFISNEGFLIKSGDQSVLIDALYRESHPDHTFPPEDVLNQMISAKGAFKGVDIYLQSHVHYTHFHPVPVGEFLWKNKNARMVASPQAVDSIVKLFPKYENVKDQLMPYLWEQKRMSFEHNGIQVEAFKIPHAAPQQWGWVQNLGHIITLGDKKVLHMGDLLWDEEVLKYMKLSEKEIDLVILPHWILGEASSNRIKELINAKNYIISHITINAEKRILSYIKQSFPEAVVMNKTMERRVFD